jgi:selenide,water dikinase
MKLTQLAACAGCAAKLPQATLAQVLTALKEAGDLPADATDARVLVGANTFDDAGVFQLTADIALVQTIDFFTPIVDDPFDYGQIAAANALSDVYAMGGRPITALNVLAIPADKVGPQAIAEILRGGQEKTREANCALIGGHTIRTLEPIYGLSVTGVVHPKKILTNADARPGDVLILSKPLGTGIATTAIKRGKASPALTARVVEVMKQLNQPGADLAERELVKAGTDVTGFGLMGHLGNIVRASGVGAEVFAGQLPVLDPDIFDLIARDCVPGGTRSNMTHADEIVDWAASRDIDRVLACDAQTSGGLLLCVRPENVNDVITVLREHRAACAAVIGRIFSASAPLIRLMP